MCGLSESQEYKGLPDKLLNYRMLALSLIINPMKFLRLLQKMRLENVFLVVAMFFGLIFIFTIKPLHGNDEIVHFPRAYQVQEGQLWTEHLGGYDYGGYVPEQIKWFNDDWRVQVQSSELDPDWVAQLQNRYNQERLIRNDPVALPFTSAGVYSPWSYAPPALGILIADSLKLPLNWYVYLARLFTMLVYVLLVYWAIRIIPFGKLFLAVVALLPTALTQGGTIGMDGLVNGLSWLIIALTLAVFTKKLVITPKILALVAFLSLYLATTKQAYGLIALLPLLLPARLYPFAYKKVWAWRVGFAGVLAATGMWYIGQTSSIASIIHFIQRPGLNIDEGAQLHYVFQNAVQFLVMIFAQPFSLVSAGIYGGMVGVMTNRTIFIPVSITILLLGTLLLTTFHKEKVAIAKRDKLFILAGAGGALVLTFILINLGLYLSFTQVGFGRVEGLQGRYFLPLLPLLGVIIHLLAPKLFFRLSDVTVMVASSIAVMAGLISASIVL